MTHSTQSSVDKEWEKALARYATDPAIANPQSRYRFSRENGQCDMYTRTHILAAAAMYDANFKRVPWQQLLSKMLAHLMPPEDLFIGDNGDKLITEKRLHSMVANIKSWNPASTKLNFVVSGLRERGAGRKDEIPLNVQLAVYRLILNVLDDPECVLYRDTISIFLRHALEDNGYKVFANNRELKRHKKLMEKLRSRQRGAYNSY